MQLGLEERVVMVSGATGAIGESVCRAFVEEGAHVVGLHRGDADRLDPLRESLVGQALEPACLTSVPADLADPDSLDRAVEQVLERFGRIDVLVNNAGTTLERPFLALRPDEVDHLVGVNLTGTLHLTRLVLKPMMRARSGSVVSVTSVVASRGGRGVAVYAATKAALESMTRALAIEMAAKGVRLNAVAPGVIETPMSRRLVRRRRDKLEQSIPLTRLGQPADVAATVLWLASDSVAAYITGQVVVVDGGLGL